MPDKQWTVWFERYPRRKGAKNSLGYGFSASTREEALRYVEDSKAVKVFLAIDLQASFDQAIETSSDPEVRKLTGIDYHSHEKDKQYVYWALWEDPEKHWYKAREERREAQRKALEKYVPNKKAIRPFSELEGAIQNRIHRILDGCWIWIGSIDENGYGNFRGRAAHRVVYSELVNDIPRGLYLLHECDNRMCVNPLHLHANTPSANYQDMVNKGRCRINSYIDYPNEAYEYGLDRNNLKQIRLDHWVQEKTVELIAQEYSVPENIIEEILEYKINR